MIDGKTLITVVRHGQTEWNELGRYQGMMDSRLTAEGITQAHRLADHLRTLSFSRLYSSDLGRAVQTAEIIADVLQIDITLDSRLRERNMGLFQGLTPREAELKYPDAFAQHKTGNPDYPVPQGECLRQTFGRTSACLDELVEKHLEESLVLVTHGGILDMIIRKVLDIPLERPRRFSLKNCSINCFSITDGIWKLESWGETR